ncbi:MAG: YfjI family protein [Pseudomonadota bacterium]
MSNYSFSSAHDETSYLADTVGTADKITVTQHSLPEIGEHWPHYDERSLVESAAIEVSEHVQVAYEMALSSALGVMSAVCQGLVDVAYPNGHLVPTSLMLLTIATTGERKTAVDKAFCKPLREFQKEKEVENRKDRAAYQRELAIWKQKEKALNKVLNKQYLDGEDTKNIEAQLHALDAERPLPPALYKLIYDNTTPSALTFGMHENIPLAFLLSDEAGNLLQGQAMKDLYLFNSLWSGSDITIDRRSSESFTLSDARLTASMMVQPPILERFMKKRGDEAHDSGFFARFLVAYPERQTTKRENLSPSSSGSQITKFQKRARERLIMSIHAMENRQLKTTLTFTAPAQKLWRDLYGHIARECREDALYAHAYGHANKLMDNISRVAAILHTFENEDYRSEISVNELSYAYKLCRHYSRHYLTYIAGTPKVVTLANDLVRAIRKYGTLNNLASQDRYTFTVSMIKQRAIPSLRDHDNFDQALSLLSRLGHIKGTPSRNGQQYEMGESIVLKALQEPELKNGEEYHVEELPKFSEQVTRDSVTGGGYFTTSQLK